MGSGLRRVAVLAGVLLLVYVAFDLCALYLLPAKVPAHFNFDGQADYWVSRGAFALGSALVMLAYVALGFLGITLLDRAFHLHAQGMRTASLVYLFVLGLVWAAWTSCLFVALFDWRFFFSLVLATGVICASFGWRAWAHRA